MQSIAQGVLSHIRRQELLHAGDRVGVAVSGGIDSVALLQLLLELRAELGIVLSVVHFNHKLRGAESDGDEQFVADLAREHDLEFHVDRDDAAQVAAEERVSVEAAARELRYGFFQGLIQDKRPQKAEVEAPTSRKGGETWGTPGYFSSEQHRGGLHKVATGHTLDDQAETVLMRMIRGSGLRGLGGIYPRIPVENEDGESCGEIVRPLLAFRRRELEEYLKHIGQAWREDSTNADHSFTRNRVRQLLVPLLEKEFNPAVAENLAELAEIARGEEDYWENEVAGWMGTVVHWSEPEWASSESKSNGLVQIACFQQGSDPNARLSGREKLDPSRASPGSLPAQAMLARDDKALQSRIDNAPWLVANALVSRVWFLGQPVAVQRRLLKSIGEKAGIPLEFKHVEEILRFAGEGGKSGRELSLPLGWKVTRQQDELLFVTPDLREPVQARDYEYLLAVPARTEIREGGFAIETRKIPASEVREYNPDELLDADSLPGPLRVRNWRAGDRFWPAHTKSPKKIKELLQERHVPQPERGLWPVVMSGDEIVWVRGFSAAIKYRAKAGKVAILISEAGAAEKAST